MPSRNVGARTEPYAWLWRAGSHLQAARLLVDGATTLPPAVAANHSSSPRWPLLPIAGGAEDAKLARWMERAASHQTRALAWLRKARDPSAGPLPASQRRDLMLRALEHILAARRLLLQAKESSADPELLAALEAYLGRLETIARSTERQLQELDTAAQG